mgnify:CR=1 FL=1
MKFYLNFIGVILTQSIHLSLDAMGGDNAPEIVVEGAAQSKIRYPELKFSFFGNENKILPLINLSTFLIMKLEIMIL